MQSDKSEIIMSAASHVADVPELLEQILSHLPPLDVIRLERVSRTWHYLITKSPLLRYTTWRSNSYPGTTKPKVIPSSQFPEPERDESESDEYHLKDYLYKVSTHLHPVFVSCILKAVPADPRFSFRLPGEERSDDIGYFSLRPKLLRELVRWYKLNSGTEAQWGGMSLYRLGMRQVAFEIPLSDGAGIPFHLEATHEKHPWGQKGKWGDKRWGKIGKEPGEELFVTLGDVLREVEGQWDEWLDGEVEVHYLSHDEGPCDYDRGMPGDGCLESGDEDDDDDDEDGGSKEKMGYKMTKEEHIDAIVDKASDGPYDDYF